MALEYVVMFALAVVSVGMWTLRVAVAASGRRAAAALVASVEAVVFVLTFSQIAGDLSSPGRLGSYAAGVAIGTAVGLFVNDRTTTGSVELQVVEPGGRGCAAGVLRANGWPATSNVGDGPDGTVTITWLTVSPGEVGVVMDALGHVAPDAFITSRPLSSATNARTRQDDVVTSAAHAGRPTPCARPASAGTH